MNKSRAVFKDLHEEEILYFEGDLKSGVLFVTKSGVYKCVPGKFFASFNPTFTRVTPCEDNVVSDIDFIVIDDTIEYKYRIDIVGGGHISGTVSVPSDAAKNTIKAAILDSIGTAKWMRE